VHTIRKVDERKDAIARLETLRAIAGHRADDVAYEIRKIRTGIKGEQEAAYHISHEFKDSEHTYVAHSLRLVHDGETCQIDHLIFNRHTRRLVIVETKHLKAKVSFNEHGEWTATYDRGTFPIESPTRQAKRHETILKRWLRDTGRDVPKDFVCVALLGSKAIISRAASIDPVPVVKADMFGVWYQSVVQSSGLIYNAGRYLDRMSHEEAMAFMKAVVSANQPEDVDWGRRFGIRERPSMPPSPLQPTFDLTSPTRGRTPFPPLSSGTPTRVAVNNGEIVVHRNGPSHRTITCEARNMARRIDTLCIAMSLSDARVEATYAWQITYEDCLRIVKELGGDASRRRLRATEPPPPAQVGLDLSHPDRIVTPMGEVELRRLAFARTALRPVASSRHLQDMLDELCMPFADWNERYENWIVDDDSLPMVRERLAAAVARPSRAA
jgi:hypothetical protein